MWLVFFIQMWDDPDEASTPKARSTSDRYYFSIVNRAFFGG